MTIDKEKYVVLVEPFYGGSHKLWADGVQKHLDARVEIISLQDKHWKWRMHGGAITLADKFNKLDPDPDTIICTDMIDLPLFLSLINTSAVIILYFHESQLGYPWLETHEDIKKDRNNHYSFINYKSALVADKVLFNSKYHLDTFLGELENLLKVFPDHRNIKTIEIISDKSKVLHLGLDLEKRELIDENDKARILWNHRWEYDKNPELFFQTLLELDLEGIDFELVVLGEQPKSENKLIASVRHQLKSKIIHWGYVDDRETYNELMSSCNIVPNTSIQDFFGISLMEGISMGMAPIIPNRLAFPELIPFEKFYYESDEEFKSKLRDCIQNKGYKEDLSQLKNHIAKFGWSNMVEEYNRILLE